MFFNSNTAMPPDRKINHLLEYQHNSDGGIVVSIASFGAVILFCWWALVQSGLGLKTKGSPLQVPLSPNTECRPVAGEVSVLLLGPWARRWNTGSPFTLTPLLNACVWCFLVRWFSFSAATFGRQGQNLADRKCGCIHSGSPFFPNVFHYSLL